MFRPEQVKAQMHDTRLSFNHSLGLPFVWNNIHVPAGSLPQIFRAQEPKFFPDQLTIDTLPSLAPQLFSDPDTLSQTVSTIAGASVGEIDILRGGLLQMGHMAHILFYDAVVGDNSYPFVVYLSKGPEGSRLAEEAEQDYSNLKMLAEAFRKGLSLETREKYDVINPIAKGNVTYNHQQYPFFTMPFLPLGELCVEFIGITDRSGTIKQAVPYLQYAVPYTEEMVETTTSQIADATTIAKRLVRENYGSLLDTKEAQQYKMQRNDLLRGIALVYYLSNRRLPKKHLVNAGDWMVIINNSELILRLITVRGGFGPPLSEEEFYEEIRSHEEPSLHDVDFSPFMTIRRDEFSEVLSQARSLIQV